MLNSINVFWIINCAVRISDCLAFIESVSNTVERVLNLLMTQLLFSLLSYLSRWQIFSSPLLSKMPTNLYWIFGLKLLIQIC